MWGRIPDIFFGFKFH